MNRQLPCQAHGIKDARGLDEDVINLLERAALGLRVEEIINNDGRQVDCRVYDVVAPRDVLETDRRHLGDEEVEQPIRRRRHGRHLGADAQRHNLRRVHERHKKEADGEKEQRDKVEEDRGAGGGFVAQVRLEPGKRRGRDGHADGAADEQLAAPDAVDEEDGEARRNRLPQLKAGGDDAGDSAGVAELLLEDCRRVESDD